MEACTDILKWDRLEENRTGGLNVDSGMYLLLAAGFFILLVAAIRIGIAPLIHEHHAEIESEYDELHMLADANIMDRDEVRNIITGLESMKMTTLKSSQIAKVKRLITMGYEGGQLDERKYEDIMSKIAAAFGNDVP